MPVKQGIDILLLLLSMPVTQGIILLLLFSLLCLIYAFETGHRSSAECNKVVSDTFGKFEFLMKYHNMGSYAHFTPFLEVIILFFSEIFRKVALTTLLH